MGWRSMGLEIGLGARVVVMCGDVVIALPRHRVRASAAPPLDV